MADHLQLAIEKELSGLGRLFDLLDGFIDENRIDSKAAFALRLVVEEIFLNLVNYSKAGQRTNEVRLSLTARPHDLTLAIEDDGVPFDPRNAPPAPLPENLEQAAPGGVGLHLVRTLVDELDYDSNELRNRLEVRILRSGAAPEASAP